MMPNHESLEQRVERADEIDIAEFLRRVRDFAFLAWRERRIVHRCLVAFIPIGLLIAFGSRTEWTASTKVLPYRPANSTTSGLSGLAGLAGLKLPSGLTEPTITADLYPEVARTLDFKLSVAETPIWFGSLGRRISTVRYFSESSDRSALDVLRKYSLGLPSLLISAARPASRPSTRPDSSIAEPPLPSYDKKYLAIIALLDDRLVVDIDRKTAIITISGTMPDAYASADLVRAAAARLMGRIIDYESRKAGEQRQFVEEEQKRARDRFEASQRLLATFNDRNRGTLSATAQIEAQRLQSEYNLTFDLYRQFSMELEQSRIKQNQDTPVFTVLEQVVVPNSPSSPRRALDLLASIMLGFSVGLSIIWWRSRRTQSEGTP